MARKRRVDTIKLFPNPYHCMGANGSLGGGTAIPEAFHGNGLPVRQYVGAEMRHENLTPGPEGKQGIASRSDRFFIFDCAAKTYEIPRGTKADFGAMLRDGSAFEVSKEDEIPVAKLSAARVALIVEHASHATGEDPDFEFWLEQFPIDGEIAKLGEASLKERLAALEKRQQEAIAARETDAKATESPAPASPSDTVKDAQKRAVAAVAAAMRAPQPASPFTESNAGKPPKSASAPKES